MFGFRLSSWVVGHLGGDRFGELVGLAGEQGEEIVERHDALDRPFVPMTGIRRQWAVAISVAAANTFVSSRRNTTVGVMIS